MKNHTWTRSMDVYWRIFFAQIQEKSWPRIQQILEFRKTGGGSMYHFRFFSKNLPICSFSRFAHFSQTSKYGAIAHLHGTHHTSAHLNKIMKIGANTDLARLFYTIIIFSFPHFAVWKNSYVADSKLGKNADFGI